MRKRARCCATASARKGERAIKFHYHPKRINHPMKRVGEKGEDKWEEISWDQAIAEISEAFGA